MKIICKLFNHKWLYYKKSGDPSIFRVCKNCGHAAYKNSRTPGWVTMFLQSWNYEDKKS